MSNRIDEQAAYHHFLHIATLTIAANHVPCGPHGDCRSYRAPIRHGMHCNHDFERWDGITTLGNGMTSAFRALAGARTLKWKVFSQAIPEGAISRNTRVSWPL